MQVVFSALLSQIKIDEKGGGYLVTLSVPECDKEEMGQLLVSGPQVFKCALISDKLVTGAHGSKEEDLE